MADPVLELLSEAPLELLSATPLDVSEPGPLVVSLPVPSVPVLDGSLVVTLVPEGAVVDEAPESSVSPSVAVAPTGSLVHAETHNADAASAGRTKRGEDHTRRVYEARVRGQHRCENPRENAALLDSAKTLRPSRDASCSRPCSKTKCDATQLAASPCRREERGADHCGGRCPTRRGKGASVARANACLIPASPSHRARPKNRAVPRLRTTSESADRAAPRCRARSPAAASRRARRRLPPRVR